jgi:dolichyl-phosphate-mannose--protein O-mannosyl transferase
MGFNLSYSRSHDLVCSLTFGQVDIHPPLVKLIYAWVLHLQGFVGARETEVQWWSKQGNIIGTADYKLVYEEAYGKPYIVMRIVAAVAGAALVPVMFLSARALGLGRVPALLASAFVLFETVSALQVRGYALIGGRGSSVRKHVVRCWGAGLMRCPLSSFCLQSRIIVCDSWLYLFDVAAIGASFASVTSDLSRPASVAWVAFTGFLLGCAMSVKFTALGIVATVAVHQALVLLFVAKGPLVDRLRTVCVHSSASDFWAR